MENATEKMPAWARRAEECCRGWERKKSEKSRRGEYVWAVIWNLIWLFIVNKVPDWNIPFINDQYMAVLWALNLNIFIQIGCNAVMFIINRYPVRCLGKMVMSAAEFLVLILLYYIYPFDFSGVKGWMWMDLVIPVVLIIGMVVSAITVVVYFWRLVFGRR